MRKIIRQIKWLKRYCESMTDKEALESVWKENATALKEVVRKLEGEYSGPNAAEVIRRIMEKEKVTPKVLAERMGCARQNVNQMLNRGTVNMRYDSFYRMAKALEYEIILRKK